MPPWPKPTVVHQPPLQQELAVYPRRRPSSAAEIPEQAERAPLIVAHSLIASSGSWKGEISPSPLASVPLQHQQHRRHPSSSSTHSQLARFAQENRRPPSPTGSTRTTSSQNSSYSSLFNSGMSNLRGLTSKEEDRMKLQEDDEAPVRERWEREREVSMRGGALEQRGGSTVASTGKGASRFKSLLRGSDGAISMSSQPATPTSTTASAGGSMYLPSPPSSPPPSTVFTTSTSSLSSRRMYPPSPTPSGPSTTPRPSLSPSPSHFLFPHPSPLPASPTSSFASSSHSRLTSKSSALSLKSDEQTTGGLRGKAARILGEDIVPSGKAAKVLGVQKEVGGVGRKLQKEMPRERREVVERIRQSPHTGNVPLPNGSPHSSSSRLPPSRSPAPIPVAHSRAPPPPPLWLPLPPPAGSLSYSITPSPSLAPLASTSTSSASARSVQGELGEWGARRAPPPPLPKRPGWRSPEDDEVSGWIESPSFPPPAEPRSHQTRLNLVLASLAAVGAARTPQQSTFNRAAPPPAPTTKSLSPDSTPSPSSSAAHERPHLSHRSSDVDPALSLSLERQIQHSTHSKGLHLSLLSTSSYGLPSDVEFYASPSDSQEEGSPVRGKLPSLASSGREKGSGGTTPIEETIEEEREGPESTPSSPSSPTTYFSSSPVLVKPAQPIPLSRSHPPDTTTTQLSSSTSSALASRPLPQRKPSIPAPPLPPKSSSRPSSATLARSNTLVSVASSRTRGFQRGNALEALEGRRGAPPLYPSSSGGRAGGRGGGAGMGERIVERSRPMGLIGEELERGGGGEKAGGRASALQVGGGGEAKRESRWFLDWSDDSGDEERSSPQPQLQTELSRQASQWSSSSGSASASAPSPIDPRPGSGSGSGESINPSRETMMTISSPLDPFFARGGPERAPPLPLPSLAENEGGEREGGHPFASLGLSAPPAPINGPLRAILSPKSPPAARSTPTPPPTLARSTPPPPPLAQRSLKAHPPAQPRLKQPSTTWKPSSQPQPPTRPPQPSARPPPRPAAAPHPPQAQAQPQLSYSFPAPSHRISAISMASSSRYDPHPYPLPQQRPQIDRSSRHSLDSAVSWLDSDDDSAEESGMFGRGKRGEEEDLTREFPAPPR